LQGHTMWMSSEVAYLATK